MNYERIDFSRILTLDEIKNITDDEYERMKKYCTIYINKMSTTSILIGSEQRSHRTGKIYINYRKQNSVPLAPPIGNVPMARYLSSTSHYLIQDIDKRKRELIYTNYTIHDDELFLKYFVQGLNESEYSDIQNLLDEINQLLFLYYNDNKKFIFMRVASKIDQKIYPIMKNFVNYYQINEPVIIINKLQEIIIKNPELLEDYKCLIKK